MVSKVEFVNKCNEVLKLAKPHLSVQYVHGKDIELTNAEEIYYQQQNGRSPYYDNEEYLLITCENEYHYVRNITANSLAAIAEELFKFVVCK